MRDEINIIVGGPIFVTVQLRVVPLLYVFLAYLARFSSSYALAYQ